MNEGNGENLEELQDDPFEYENELPELEEGETAEEDGEVITYDNMGADTSQEEELETVVDTVSDGDSNDIMEQILIELQLTNSKMDELQEYQAERDVNLFVKPLEEYTVTESLLLVIFLGFVACCIFRLVGGILRCKKQ